MNRNLILFAIVAVFAGRMSVCLKSSGVAMGQTTTATPVLQDNFDDNKIGTPWKVFGTNAKAKVAEANKRLQFTTTSDVNVPFMGYISDKWWIDPNQDFQMKVDLHFDIFSYSNAWVCFGVTPKSTGPDDVYATVGIGCSGVFQNYWAEWHDGYVGRMDFEGRVLPTVTLYISYDSWYDVLYLSDNGYGSQGTWETLSGFVKGQMGRVPLYVFLAAKTQSMAIDSSGVYMDNFVIEKGKLGSPYNQPTDPNSGGDDGGVKDITGTLAMLPSTLQRSAASDKLTALVALPAGVTLADWDSTKMPVLSPGGIAATAQTAFIWADDTVKILASFSKTKLMQAVSTNGQTEVYVSGTLKDGTTYAASCAVTINP
jgi:hypothetical protein